MIVRDHRDLVIEALAADEAAARRERDAYRLLLVLVLEQRHKQGLVSQRQQETIVRDRAAHRRLRERALVEVKVAA